MLYRFAPYAVALFLLFALFSIVRGESDFPGSVEALDEVNAARAKRGLPPFERDPALTTAARSAAHYRAARGMKGHTPNDFTHVPAGGSASAAGCAAWPPELGWGSCCTYEAWTYAGAAYVVGQDGRRYMSLFVRGSLDAGPGNMSAPVRRGFSARRGR